MAKEWKVSLPHNEAVLVRFAYNGSALLTIADESGGRALVIASAEMRELAIKLIEAACVADLVRNGDY